MSHLLEEITSPLSQWDHISLDYNSIWITNTSKILSPMSQSTLNMAMQLNETSHKIFPDSTNAFKIDTFVNMKTLHFLLNVQAWEWTKQ